MPKFSHHIFVCTNERPDVGRASCAVGGSREVYRVLSEHLTRDKTLIDRVGLTACDCLGPCFDGPNLVIYPEGIWYAEVTAQDVPEIVESHLRNGTPVERLVYDWGE